MEATIQIETLKKKIASTCVIKFFIMELTALTLPICKGNHLRKTFIYILDGTDELSLPR